jgi:hypothetical protein
VQHQFQCQWQRHRWQLGHSWCNKSAASVSASGNIDGGNLVSAALVQGVTVSASGNVIGGNLVTAGLISAGANITGANIGHCWLILQQLGTGGLVSAGGTSQVPTWSLVDWPL